MWRRTLVAALGCAAVLSSSARAQGVDETCLLALTKFDPATVNVAYPDESAVYYGANFVLAPGMRVRISGRFPHARYMSFNAYDPALRPVDAVNDVHIQPDAGSTNPFLPHADRTTEQRAYTVFIEAGERPANPAPNTLYPGIGQDGTPNPAGMFLFRIYVPDKGRDATGGVGLPTVTIESTSSAPPSSPSPCTNVEKPSVEGVNEALANQELPEGPSTSGTNPPTWRKFVNLASSVAINVFGEPNPGGVDLDTLGGSGGFLSNRDNAYVSAPINRRYGQVLVTRMRAPTFPDTRAGARRMPTGQLRYWSLCQNDPPTQRFVSCLNDDRSVQSRDGYVTFVVSMHSQRPHNATAACGVNWLVWGPDQRGVLIYRHMLPDAGFTQSIQAAEVDHEAETMEDFFPRSTYYADAAAYDRAVGCAASPRRARRDGRRRTATRSAASHARSRAPRRSR